MMIDYATLYKAHHYVTFKDAGQKPKRADLEAIAKEVDGHDGGRGADWKSIMYWFWRPTFAADAQPLSSNTFTELAINSPGRELRPEESVASQGAKMKGRRPPREMKRARERTKRIALQSLQGSSCATGGMTNKTMNYVRNARMHAP